METIIIRSGPSRPGELSVWSEYVDRFLVPSIGAYPVAILRAMCLAVEPGSVQRCDAAEVGALAGMRGPFAGQGVDLYLRLLHRRGLACVRLDGPISEVGIRPSIAALRDAQVRSLPEALRAAHANWVRFDEIVAATPDPAGLNRRPGPHGRIGRSGGWWQDQR